ncbi:MAG: N-acetylmuramoyl-L-alanine amidase [Candidatus Eisenbacteria bacterium]|uniref:N-acetylmuramoyl-L-alanine amidase n=1 Tax=Eiseniibacteriota bacterium TaxID=2212470 RepID=A0A7Y2H3N5_UNCEI|nr:N-acetylmuramoyl-L-alanine amidase [Candidatus Eisenbacteria bacterium]
MSLSLRRSALSMFVFVFLLGWAHDSSAIEVNGIRFSTTEKRTRVVIDLDAMGAYTHETMVNPPRVVVTFAASSITADIKRPVINNGHVKKVRTNELRDGRIQVVLDLNHDAPYQTFTLDRPPRVVIDVAHEEKREVFRNEAVEEKKPEVNKVKPAERPAREGPWIVAIDAGHGGKDPGSSHHNLREKDVVLALARATFEELNTRPNIKAVMIRKGDYYIPLRKRWELAEEKNADVFVSIHCDGAHRKAAKGTSVYFLSLKGATDAASRELAERENSVDEEAMKEQELGELGNILFDMTQNDAVSKSEILAETVLDKLFALGTVYSRGVKQAGFAVLKSPRMPSILVEAAFISNAEENRLLRNRNWQRNFGRHLANGIEAYTKNVEASE